MLYYLHQQQWVVCIYNNDPHDFHPPLDYLPFHNLNHYNKLLPKIVVLLTTNYTCDSDDDIVSRNCYYLFHHLETSKQDLSHVS